MTFPLRKNKQNLSKRWESKVARIFSLVQKKPRGYQNYLLNMLSEKLHMERSLGNPVSIILEPTNICNLQCPICETGAGLLKRKPQMMSYESFVRIMDKVGRGANHLMFYYMGEPFLNKDSYRMIRYARDMGLCVTTCTNGDCVNPEALYDSGINHISFQIGGVTQRTHEVYRRNSELSAILRNLEAYLQILRKQGRKDGEHEVEMGLIVMKQNEGEIGDFLKLCDEIKVKATLISPCVRTYEQGKEFLPEAEMYWLYDREIFEKDGQLTIKRAIPWNSCPWLYYAITIQVDGNVVPCCRDAQGQYILGNLLSEHLEEIWNGPRFRKWRGQFRRGEVQPPLCHLCPGEGAPELK
jgi:radical SAM protein with 4Fe4S-binding SPASM domain